MKIPARAVALFCEDIRLEAGGQVSLIGIFSDTIAVPGFPGQMAKLGFYARVLVDADDTPEALSIILRNPGMPDVEISDFTAEKIGEYVADATRAGNPITGLVAHAMFSPFPVQAAGRATLVLKTPTDEQLLAILNFVQAPA